VNGRPTEGERRVILVTGLGRLWAGVTSVASGLARENVSTIFYYREIKKQYTQGVEEGMQVVPCPRNPLVGAWELWRLLIQHKPDHVEMYHNLGWVVTFLHLLVLWLSRIPVIVVCVGGEIRYWETHSLIKKASVRMSFRVANAVIIKEKGMVDSVIRHRIGDPDKLIFSPNRIQIKPLETKKKEGRIILYLNSFTWWRNVDLILRAAPLVLEAFPDARFLLVGLTGRPEEIRIHQLVQSLNLKESVSLLPFTNRQKMYYGQASLFLLPSDVVFCNNALLEAMERGVPPIVARVPEADLVVEHRRSGLLVDKTPDALAEAIINLLQDDDLRLELGKGARERVRQHFPERSRTELLMDLYRTRIWAT
jgi:glycosyltransferase involved in cell wall biosynthesis